MSQYTTGELARLCNVSVRTVQYYDARGILEPSALSEGGRRLYSERDLKKMKIICFLRELDLPINSIKELLDEPEPEKTLALLIEKRTKELQIEQEENQKQLQKLQELKQNLNKAEQFSFETIGDVAHIMENKKKLRRTRAIMIIVGILIEMIEIGTLIYALKSGNWWPFGVGMVAVIALAIWLSAFYYKRTAYICPQCHKIFHPNFKEVFFANHTPNTRKLTCPGCSHKGFCVETYCEPKT